MRYPNLKQLLGSKSDNSDGVIIDRAADGSVRSRSTWDKRRKSFAPRHILTLAQYEELLTFYDAHRGVDAEFDFVWVPDKRTYRCIFNAAPKEDSIEIAGDGLRYFVTCSLVEV
ncbi:MAG: hypothetical protein LBI35_05250 [Burkholderiales bacterium]|jgi:hypothetical protein|nr:hypothetical protein [Burkholderiales bacterium]